MSTRNQQGHQQAQLADYQRRPEWTAGYTHPVVVASGGGDKHQHRPDRTSDEPQPACGSKLRNDKREWVVEERDTDNVWRSDCQAHGCYGGDDP